ncbi:MAG: nucleotidyltransferase [Clostridiaceae bacterium]|nr:nucleotidyltransferase [Clostridiaceae bacterium]
MVKPILVVMAAGMGSRYGGLKQIEPVGPGGEIILDYSVYDAIRAGFERVIFIIKKSIEQDFSACIDPGMRKKIQIDYAFQELEAIPESFNIPEGREKPWGTGQAILAAGDLIDAPFVVINADDYYGPQAFGLMYDHLSAARSPEDTYALCTWQLANTLSEHGHVSRGVCALSDDSYLQEIIETKQIYQTADGGKYRLDDERDWQELAAATPVSMNFWGLPQDFLRQLEERFPLFLASDVTSDPMKAEFLLPEVIDNCIKAGLIKVKAMPVADRWYGITYREDRPKVMHALAELTAGGLYPTKLWP